MGSNNTTQDQDTEINFLLLKLQWPAGFLEEGGRENFFSWKIRTLLLFFILKIRPLLIQLREKFSKFKMTSVTHFHYELDTCPTLGLWIWQVSYTCQNSPISFPLGGKFKFWISFLPSLQNPPIDPSGLSTFESRPISAIGPQTCLGPKTFFVPI